LITAKAAKGAKELRRMRVETIMASAKAFTAEFAESAEEKFKTLISNSFFPQFLSATSAFSKEDEG
jgi:hypothetical protein